MSDLSVGKKLKKMWKKSGAKVSLRQFVKELAAGGSEEAKLWFENKEGALNEGRSSAKATRIKLEREATKAAKRKKV